MGATQSFDPMHEASGPGEAAEMAAEALRTVNHLTISAPSSGVPGWENVGDLYRVLGEVTVLTDRLPQGLRQLAQHLERPAGLEVFKADNGTDESSERLVAAAVLALGAAQRHVAEAASHLHAGRDPPGSTGEAVRLLIRPRPTNRKRVVGEGRL